jgi:hypothetical protein
VDDEDDEEAEDDDELAPLLVAPEPPLPAVLVPLPNASPLLELPVELALDSVDPASIAHE